MEKSERVFHDIESGEIVYESELLTEYFLNVLDDPETYNYTFEEYISNCLTRNNGTLEQVTNIYRI